MFGSAWKRAGRSASWAFSSASLLDSSNGPKYYHVYRGRTGKYVLHIEREAQFTATDSQGKPAGWRGWVGLGDVKYGSSPKESTIEVVPTLEELEPQVAPELFAIVSRSARHPLWRSSTSELLTGAAALVGGAA